MASDLELDTSHLTDAQKDNLKNSLMPYLQDLVAITNPTVEKQEIEVFSDFLWVFYL
jgi:hypothetical protein